MKHVEFFSFINHLDNTIEYWTVEYDKTILNGTK